MHMFRFVFPAALLLFGLTAGVTPAPADDWIPSCEGAILPMCAQEEVERCVNWVPCGWVPPIFIHACCAEKETVIDYYYFDEDVDAHDDNDWVSH